MAFLPSMFIYIVFFIIIIPSLFSIFSHCWDVLSLSSFPLGSFPETYFLEGCNLF